MTEPTRVKAVTYTGKKNWRINGGIVYPGETYYRATLDLGGGRTTVQDWHRHLVAAKIDADYDIVIDED